jgi:GH15 family glucan-1,4-alpha-glucosidase
MAYLPIEDYGMVGNMQTVALVSKAGSIDWFCPQKFDGPSVFARILDEKQGGYFQIVAQSAEATLRQDYWPDTNILVTRFLCEDGVAEVVDYMPVGPDLDTDSTPLLVRTVKMVRGLLPMRLECHPAFNYARDSHTLELTPQGAIFTADSYAFSLASPVELVAEEGGVSAEFVLQAGESVTFTVQPHTPGESSCPAPLHSAAADACFRVTVAYWRRWLEKCTYTGRWREMVYRSALMMKLLTYAPTGAIVAAPTCSLPEEIGGTRNWDYRYTWIRDAAFTLYGFMRIGFTEEAEAFIGWLTARIQELEPDGMLQIMYTIDGDHEIPEIELSHLSGYRNSAPVRIGNAAYQQLQLDIYGELLDSIYLYNKYGQPISDALWQQIRKMLDWVSENWQREDKGIWEIRGVDQPFVYSKVMLWVALDRGLRLADKRSFPAPRARWLETRDAIYAEIMARGWNEEIGAFTQFYGGDSLDAANLIMPLVFFVSPNDPRMLRTLAAINRLPQAGGLVADSLVFRYNVADGIDGLEQDEGTFNMCTFWLVEALTRAGQLDEARYMFEKMLGYANHLGLYAEETGARGEALGNFPQAFTHLSLISAAFNLDRALGK